MKWPKVFPFAALLLLVTLSIAKDARADYYYHCVYGIVEVPFSCSGANGCTSSNVKTVCQYYTGGYACLPEAGSGECCGNTIYWASYFTPDGLSQKCYNEDDFPQTRLMPSKPTGGNKQTRVATKRKSDLELLFPKYVHVSVLQVCSGKYEDLELVAMGVVGGPYYRSTELFNKVYETRMREDGLRDKSYIKSRNVRSIQGGSK